VLGTGGSSCRAELLPPFGHDQPQADRIHGHRVAADDQAFVVPHVAAAEVVGPASVELGSQGAEDVQPGLSLDLGRSRETQGGAIVGMIVRLRLPNMM